MADASTMDEDLLDLVGYLMHLTETSTQHGTIHLTPRDTRMFQEYTASIRAAMARISEGRRDAVRLEYLRARGYLSHYHLGDLMSLDHLREELDQEINEGGGW